MYHNCKFSRSLQEDKYDHVTATYFLIAERILKKRHGFAALHVKLEERHSYPYEYIANRCVNLLTPVNRRVLLYHITILLCILLWHASLCTNPLHYIIDNNKLGICEDSLGTISKLFSKTVILNTRNKLKLEKLS